MNTKPFPPLPDSPVKPIRLTIPVDAETHAVFQRLGKAGNTSTGRAMGSWLHDTVQAAEYLAASMEKARTAPQLVARELHAYAMALTEETSTMMETIKRKGAEARAGDATAEGTRLRGVADEAQPDQIPPPCNTGGKLSKTQATPTKGNSRFPLPAAKVQAHANTNGVPPKAPK
jgi:hypothetical protein